jgi:hypothetical protein
MHDVMMIFGFLLLCCCRLFFAGRRSSAFFLFSVMLAGFSSALFRVFQVVLSF